MGESTYGEMQYIEKRILRLRFSVIRGRNGVLCVLFAGGTATEATGHFVAFRRVFVARSLNGLSQS